MTYDKVKLDEITRKLSSDEWNIVVQFFVDIFFKKQEDFNQSKTKELVYAR